MKRIAITTAAVIAIAATSYVATAQASDPAAYTTNAKAVQAGTYDVETSHTRV